MKRFLRTAALTVGAALTISIVAQQQPVTDVLAQASPSVSPVVSPVASPVTAPAPRAGGFPIELAWPMVAGGAAAVGAGALLLRRGRSK
ncbi:MAG: hypothetical protein U0893_19630 [Chloroflexota bacterium]